MSTSTIHDSIKQGIANFKADATEYGTVHPTGEKKALPNLQTHPNRNLRLTDLPSFTIGRQTMDRRQGKDGFVIFTVKATTAAEAARMVEAQVADINAPFRKREFGV